jgi:hypothetical protein
LKENSIQFNPGIVFVVPVNQVARKKKNRPERHQDSLFKPRRRFSELSFRTSSGFTRLWHRGVFLLGCRTFSGHS